MSRKSMNKDLYLDICDSLERKTRQLYELIVHCNCNGKQRFVISHVAEALQFDDDSVKCLLKILFNKQYIYIDPIIKDGDEVVEISAKVLGIFDESVLENRFLRNTQDGSDMSTNDLLEELSKRGIPTDAIKSPQDYHNDLVKRFDERIMIFVEKLPISSNAVYACTNMLRSGVPNVCKYLLDSFACRYISDDEIDNKIKLSFDQIIISSATAQYEVDSNQRRTT